MLILDWMTLNETKTEITSPCQKEKKMIAFIQTYFGIGL